MNDEALSRSSTQATTYSLEGHSHADEMHSTCPPSPTLSDSNQSMIFERNVEDPYMVSAGMNSNPISKHGSTTSLLSRQYSNASQHLQPQFYGGGAGGHRQSVSHPLPHSPPSEGHSPEVVMPKLDRRRTLENFVAPALDASCSIVTDDNADLDDLDIVYMRRPSTLGLDMALGRTKSNSSATITSSQNMNASNNTNTYNNNNYNNNITQTPLLGLSRSYSNSNSSPNPAANANGGGQQQDAKTLRFYSYADMLSDEMASNPSAKNFRRPSLSHSSSLCHLRPNQLKPSLTTNFSNPFIKKRDSVSNPSSASTSNLSRHYSNTVLSRSPTYQPSSQQQERAKCCCVKDDMNEKGSKFQNKDNPNLNVNQSINQNLNANSNPRYAISKVSQRSGKSNFHIESSGSEELSTDDENDNFHPLTTTSPNVMSPSTFLGPRVSRSSTQNSINSGSPLYSSRTYSNGGNNPISPSIIRRRESGSAFSPHSINNVMMYDDTLQTETVGEALRKKVSNRRDNAIN